MVHALHSQAGSAHVCHWGYLDICKLRQALTVEGFLSINETPQVTEVVDLSLCEFVSCVLREDQKHSSIAAHIQPRPHWSISAPPDSREFVQCS